MAKRSLKISLGYLFKGQLLLRDKRNCLISILDKYRSGFQINGALSLVKTTNMILGAPTLTCSE
jgi:hypothetical protein